MSGEILVLIENNEINLTMLRYWVYNNANDTHPAPKRLNNVIGLASAVGCFVSVGIYESVYSKSAHYK